MAIVVEKAPQHWWVAALFRGCALALLILFISMAWTGTEGWWVTGIVSLVLLLASISFTNMHYELHDDRVEAWLWPFSERIPFVAITRVERGKRIPWYAGMGIHGFWGTLYFNSRYGEAVVIHHEKGGWWKRVALTTKDPASFAREVEERVAAARKGKVQKAKKRA